MDNEEKHLRQTVRSLIKEELSPSAKSTVMTDLKTEVENVINSVLIDHGVHKQGLSDQQCAKLYKEVQRAVDNTLEEFKSTRKPSEVDGFADYEKYIDSM